MNKNLLVSVIVPVYNIEDYIERCIKSLLRQTYKNIEVLLINDGSTDNSEEYCKKYVDNKKIFLYSKHNGGLSDARNYGLKFAKGRYVIFVDGDDYVDPLYISELYSAVTMYHAQVAMCSYKEVDEQGNIINIVNINEESDAKVITGKKILHNFYKSGGVVDQVVWNKIYDISLFSKIKFASGKFYEDGYIIAPLYWDVSCVSLVRKALYNYVQRDNSIMHTEISHKKIEDSEGTYKYRLNFFKNRDKGLYELAAVDYKNWILRFLTKYNNFDRYYMNHLQLEYQKYYKVGKNQSLKHKIVNWMANKDLPFTIKLKRKIKR